HQHDAYSPSVLERFEALGDLVVSCCDEETADAICAPGRRELAAKGHAFKVGQLIPRLWQGEHRTIVHNGSSVQPEVYNYGMYLASIERYDFRDGNGMVLRWSRRLTAPLGGPIV